ncbi:MAG: sensor histidine kinase [Usitatibacter sp.]
MPDRLVELYQRLTDKVEAIDALVESGGIARDPESFGAEWSGLVELVSRQKAMLRDIVKRAEELASLSSFLQTHYEREKAGLARELHDQLGGILTPAKMDLAWLQSRLGDDPQYEHKLARLSALIDQGIDLKRRIIENLRPSLLDHLGFAAAVQWYVDETCNAANLQHRVTIAKLERLPSDLEIALYRVVQESVTNIIRHAKARNVELIVERTDKGLRVAVCDDGVGIEDMDRARKLSHGLAGMTERMRAIQGTLDIKSSRGEGTRVEAFLPIAA